MEHSPAESPLDSSQPPVSPETPVEPGPPPAPNRPTLVGREGRLAFVTGVGYLLFWPLVRAISSGAMLIVAATTLISLFLVLLFTVRLARAMRSPRAIGLNLLLSLLVVLPSFFPLLSRLVPFWAGWRALLPFWQHYSLLFHTVNGLHALGLIWLAASIGVAVSRLAGEFKLLLPMGVALALVDLWAVFGGGLVETAVSGKSTLARTAMNALTVQLPTLQPKTGAAPFPLLIGFADFLFISVFFACFVRFDIPARRTFQVLFVTLFLYMGAVFLGGISLPALAPIAAVVIGMNWRRFRYERSEAFALLYAGLLLCGALLYLVVRARRH
jgi:hypothetical protein